MATNLNQPPSISLGKITGAHGVKGLVKIQFYGEDAALLEHAASHTITIKSITKKYILAEIEGITSKEAADALRGQDILINRDMLPPLGPDEVYIEDLKNLDALNPEGQKIGTVIDVQNFGAGNLLEIKPESGKSFYVPFSAADISDAGFVVVSAGWDE